MLTRDAHTSIPTVKVGGAPLMPPQLASSITRVVVERQRNLPAMCEVEFLVSEGLIITPPVTDNPQMRPGAALKVEAGPSEDDPTQIALGPLFDGEVVAIEASFTPDGGRRFLLRGYDKSHRLHRTRRTKPWPMKPDNLIAMEIGQEHGVNVAAMPTGGPQEYLCQRNQTDWEFLLERARANGFEVGMEFLTGNLMFRPTGADPAAGVPQPLDVHNNLLSFRVRATSAEQPRGTKAYSWNTMLKQQLALPGRPPVTSENTLTDALLQPLTIAARFGSTEDVGVAAEIELPPDAVAKATNLHAHAAGASIEAEGMCIFNPALVPAGKISVSNAGMTFDATYVLTTVRHVFDRDREGGVTYFTVSGVHDRSLFGLTQPGAATGANGATDGGMKLPGVVIGKVTNTNDIHNRCRVKVEFPGLGDSVESNWAHVVSMGAGSDKGFQCIPEVGDQVAVVFEQGDINHPLVLGGIYGPLTELPEPQLMALQNGETKVHVFKTSTGHTLRFAKTATPPDESILIETSGGSKLEITELPTNTITLKAGQNEIVIDATPPGKISLKSPGDINIEAMGNLTLKGMQGVAIEGTGPVDVKSTAAKLTLDGGPMTEVKGIMVKIN